MLMAIIRYPVIHNSNKVLGLAQKKKKKKKDFKAERNQKYKQNLIDSDWKVFWISFPGSFSLKYIFV